MQENYKRNQYIIIWQNLYHTIYIYIYNAKQEKNDE